MAEGSNNSPELPLNDAGKAPVADGGAAPVTSISYDDLKAAGVPETFFGKDGFDAKGLGTQFADLAKLKTTAEERAAGVPKDGKYSFDLPADFEKPAGFEWTPDATFTTEVAAAAKEMGLTQAEVSNLTKLYAVQDARKQMAAMTAEKTRVESEMAKLGTNAKERIATNAKAINATFGERLGKLIMGSDLMSTAEGVIEVEGFINGLNSKVASRSAGNGTAPKSNGAELVGKPGAGRKLLEMANAPKH
jgi:hypothetical protein